MNEGRWTEMLFCILDISFVQSVKTDFIHGCGHDECLFCGKTDGMRKYFPAYKSELKERSR